MTASSVSVRAFRPGEPGAYLRRVAPFAALAAVELGALTTVGVVVTNGTNQAVVGVISGCVAVAALVGICRPAFAKHELSADSVRIRCGARLDWTVPISSIRHARRVESGQLSALDRFGLGPTVAGNRLVAVLGDAPLVELTFDDPLPVSVRRSHGWVSEALIGVEDPDGFLAALGRSRSRSSNTLDDAAELAVRDVTGSSAAQSARPSTPLIRVCGLVKRFGAATVLDGVDLAVGAGELVALVGGNGSGKSTTLKLLAGLLSADDGTLTISGDPVGSIGATAATGFIPDRPVFYERLTGRENLLFVAQAHRVPDAKGRIEPLLREFRLHNAAETRASTYSLGMAKKLTIAAALLHDPSVLLADEPTIGIDLQATRTLIDTFDRRRAAGQATVVATHDLRVAERADRVVVIDNGRVHFDGPPIELRDHARSGDLADALLTVTS